MLGPKRYRLPCDFTERTFMLFGRSREANVPCRLQIPLRHYAEIQWNPVSFRFIRDTLRTSLRSICLLRDCRVSPSMELILFKYGRYPPWESGMCVSMSLISQVMIPTTNVSGTINIPTEFSL